MTNNQSIIISESSLLIKHFYINGQVLKKGIILNTMETNLNYKINRNRVNVKYVEKILFIKARFIITLSVVFNVAYN